MGRIVQRLCRVQFRHVSFYRIVTPCLRPPHHARSTPPALNVQHRRALGPVDYAEDTVALTSERLSVYLKAHRHPTGCLDSGEGYPSLPLTRKAPPRPLYLKGQSTAPLHSPPLPPRQRRMTPTSRSSCAPLLSFNDFSPQRSRPHRAYGFFSNPTPPTRLSHPPQRLK
ncbi:hypothetical protein DFP72DRAFT_509112 [Ephemerocybe angulata]|uniref:Uncharacterized protein n=1 Tax=Ephemerocybe angulata TaxID=980116 RepID=A0A8H6HQG6_9AGAR|nr:hypothetical protein DFP72DRAFT_509112 [Tulosesus angulatus]